ncbi:MAG: DUF4962 domain-containing protein, partial [Bacteroidales bacterium]|nr:DUF4962 domain-containing protein [Bacteroidales bacterium]
MDKYLFIDQNIQKLREETATIRARLYKRLYNQCRKYFLESLPQEHPLITITYMGIASANLSLMYLLTGQPAYLNEAKRWIFNCVQFPHWGHGEKQDVDLSAAWLMFGLGLSYAWLTDALTKNERTLLKEKLILQGTRMYEYKLQTEGRGWSTNYWQNHNWINMNGLATAGYALVAEYPQAQMWINAAKENFAFVYSALADDGSDYEGVPYWRYGAMWLYIYAHLLKEREGINYFDSCGFLKNSFYYRLYQAAPNLEEQINFGDSHDRRSGHSTAIYYKFAAEYQNGHAQKMGNLVVDKFLYREAMESGVRPGILPECLFEFLFYDPTVPEKDFDDLPLEKYFEDMGLIVVRSSWDKDATHFSFKCSYPGGKKQWKLAHDLKNEKGYHSLGLSHQHPDNNTFILVDRDTWHAVDDGYNRTSKAEMHNTVLVDGKGYEGETVKNFMARYSPEMVGEIEKFMDTDSFVYIVGETGKTYRKDLKLNRFTRHVLYTRKRFFIIFDELDSELEHDYTWQLNSDVFPTKAFGGYHYQNGPGEMMLYPILPQKAEVEMQEHVIREYMTPQQPDEFRQAVLKTLSLTTTAKKKSANFLNVLTLGKPVEQKYAITPINTE